MAQKLTQAGYDKLAAELENLKTEGRSKVAEDIKEARSHGDLSENSEYDEAMNDQGRLEARIAELETIIKDAIIISDAQEGIHLGSVIRLKDLDDGEEDDFVLLGENESAHDDINYISGESPAGKALMGKGKGDTVSFEAPGGTASYKVVKIIK